MTRKRPTTHLLAVLGRLARRLVVPRWRHCTTSFGRRRCLGGPDELTLVTQGVVVWGLVQEVSTGQGGRGVKGMPLERVTLGYRRLESVDAVAYSHGVRHG